MFICGTQTIGLKWWQGELYVLVACVLRCRACDLAPPAGASAENPIWVEKACRAAMAFFLYSGFLYLLKWTTFWRVMPAIGFDRSRTEGFLILISTLVWLIATLRILLRGFRLSGARSGASDNSGPLQKRLGVASR